ncbi:hypothetical protein ACN28S_23220 [Cystobacter fuscus]
MPIDNRKTTRFASRLRCWCESEDITLYARVANLSEGGCSCRRARPWTRAAGRGCGWEAGWCTR